uniref:Phosphate uptake regulator PhoU n=1 Tax=Ignisphaera aggregans TaxID=334771 RepID=A0A7C4FH47_9CREN
MAMYRRRVQRIGKSTYIVSLPNSWAREIGLEPKMSVVMEVLPDLSLRIYVPSKQSRSSVAEHNVSVDPSLSEEDVVREVIGGYVAGASTIRIAYKGVRRDVVERAVSIAKEKLMGLELIDEDTANIVLQVVVDPNLSNLNSVMKRMIRLSVSMHEDIVSYLLGSADRSILEAVIARDNLVDKLYLLALRQLITILRDPYEMGKRGLRYYDAIYMTMFIKSVERVGDHGVNVSKSLLLLDTPPTFIVDLYKGAIDVFRSVCESFILIDKDIAIDAVRNLEKLKSLEEDIRRRHREELARKTAVTRILDAISRIVARSVDIAEEVIDIYALKKMDKLKAAESEEEEQLKQI